MPAGGRAGLPRELEWIAHDLEDEPAMPEAEPAAKALGDALAVRRRP
jgi:hypothetical protein